MCTLHKVVSIRRRHSGLVLPPHRYVTYLFERFRKYRKHLLMHSFEIFDNADVGTEAVVEIEIDY